MEPLNAQTTNTDAQQAPSSKRSGGLATASLVVGIVALVIGVLPVIGIAAGVVAIILGVKALRASYATGPSVAGIVTGALGALTSIISTIVVAMMVVSLVGFSLSSPSSSPAQQHEALIQQLNDSQKNFPKGSTARLGTLEVKIDSVRRDIPVTGLFTYQTDTSEFVHVRMTIKRVASLGSDGVSTGSFALTDHHSTQLTESLPFGPEQEDDLIFEDLPVGESITRSIVFKIPRGIKELDLVYTEAYSELKSEGTPSLEDVENLSLDDFVHKEIVYRLEI